MQIINSVGPFVVRNGYATCVTYMNSNEFEQLSNACYMSRMSHMCDIRSVTILHVAYKPY